MNYIKFLELHATYATAMRAYVIEAEKLCVMLRKCTAEPLSFTERLNLLLRETAEKDAHTSYLGNKKLLHAVALFGSGFSN
jgi:hypothetical protein